MNYLYDFVRCCRGYSFPRGGSNEDRDIYSRSSLPRRPCSQKKARNAGIQGSRSQIRKIPEYEQARNARLCFEKVKAGTRPALVQRDANKSRGKDGKKKTRKKTVVETMFDDLAIGLKGACCTASCAAKGCSAQL